MKFLSSVVLLAAAASTLSLPNGDVAARDLDARAPKGGGGGGGRGGSGSSGGGKGGSESSSSSSSSGSRPGSSLSSTGGRTSTGSGPPPRIGGFYGGGASVPYRSGQRSASGINPLILGAGLGLGLGAALWIHGAYIYPYTHPFIFHNASSNKNESKPVDCLCAVNEECGCDDNSNTTYIESLIGDGSYAGLNQSLVTVTDVNGTSTIVINGTLPNGTTASGGTGSANAASPLTQPGGYMALVALIAAGVFLL